MALGQYCPLLSHPLMPSIPLHIGIPEDSHLKNEGDRQKKLYSFYIRVVNLLTTKHNFIGIKIPLSR